MASLEFRIGELERRLSNVANLGVVSEVDHDTQRCKVKIGGSEFGGWLQWCAIAAGQVRMWRAPAVGEQCMVFAPNGEPTDAKVLPATYCDAYPSPGNNPDHHVTQYPDGSLVRHDFGASQYDFEIKGDFNVKADGKITLDAGVDIALVAAGKIEAEAGSLVSLVAAELVKAFAAQTGLSITPENAELSGEFNLGGPEGAPIARVGDMVTVGSGSSAGQWPITSGSSKVRAE
jgi:phage baseplate assembly protein V